MVGCSPDGWILLDTFYSWTQLTMTQLTMMQLYYKIVSIDIQMKHQMNTIHKGDIILIDRGFRDVL